MKKSIKWTKENVMIEALKYQTRTEFKEKCNSAYYRAIKDKYLDDVCCHMVLKKRKNWTIDEILLITKKYDSKISFRNNDYGAYLCAKKRKWLDIVCSHMKQNIYWKDKKEIIYQEALKYKTRGEFCVMSERFYEIARRHNWLDDICKHMYSVGNKFNRLVYVYEFEDKSVYIGLTFNEEKRNNSHFNDKKSPVFKHMTKTNNVPIKKIITDGYVDSEIAKKIEGDTIECYKNNGWIVLNSAKPGGLGKTLKWTKDIVHSEILKYKSMKEFRTESKYAYRAMIRNGWRDIIPHDFKINYIGMWLYKKNFKNSI